jgi:hypothetical protein
VSIIAMGSPAWPMRVQTERMAAVVVNGIDGDYRPIHAAVAP